METLRRLPLTDCDVIQKLEQIVDIAALSKEDRMKYDESIKVYRDKLATATNWPSWHLSDKKDRPKAVPKASWK